MSSKSVKQVVLDAIAKLNKAGYDRYDTLIERLASVDDDDSQGVKGVVTSWVAQNESNNLSTKSDSIVSALNSAMPSTRPSTVNPDHQYDDLYAEPAPASEPSSGGLDSTFLSNHEHDEQVRKDRIAKVNASNADPIVKARVIEQINAGNTASIDSLIDFFDGPNMPSSTPPSGGTGGGGGGGSGGSTSGGSGGGSAPVVDPAIARNASINALFEEIVGRPADENDLRIHGASLASGAINLDQLREQLTSSSEAQAYRDKLSGNNGLEGNDKLINDIFKQYVGREADSEDLRIHNERIANGQSIDEFRAGISAAPEAQAYREKLIKDVFKQYVGREADSDDLRIHGTALAEGTKTAADFRIEIANAPEAKQYQESLLAGKASEYSDFINKMFQQYVGRPADADDQRIHGTALANGSMTEDEFRLMLTNSPEAQTYRDKLSGNNGLKDNDKFINDIFKQYVGRKADSDDLRIHNERIANGQSLEDFKAGIIAAPESQAYREKTIRDTFRQFVGREADSEDIRIHSAALAGGKTVDQFRGEIANAPEAIAFQNRALGNQNPDPVMPAAVAAATAIVDEPAAPVTPPTLSQAERDQIAGMYRQYLGREASAAEIDYHGAAVLNGSVSMAQINLNIANSPEANAHQASVVAQADANRMAGINAQVNSLFQQYVGRSADADDLRIHGSALASGAVTTDVLKQQLAAAPESQSYRASLIENTFQQYVGRSADADDHQIHGTALASGAVTADQFRASIAAAPEAQAYQNMVNTTQFTNQ